MWENIIEVDIMNKYIKEVIFENKQELYEDLTKLSESIKKITLKKQ